jgi:hypothetical protein
MSMLEQEKPHRSFRWVTAESLLSPRQWSFAKTHRWPDKATLRQAIVAVARGQVDFIQAFAAYETGHEIWLC